MISKKARAEKCCILACLTRRDLSYETNSRPKTKTVSRLQFPSDGGGFPTTLDVWRSPGPTCPGTKYPVRGIPHFDDCDLDNSFDRCNIRETETEPIAQTMTRATDHRESSVEPGDAAR